MKNNRLTVQELYARIDGLTEEQLDKILAFIDQTADRSEEGSGKEQE